MLYRLPPQDIDTEESIISVCLNYPEDAKEVVDLIKPDVFYKTSHSEIFLSISNLISSGSEVDVLSVVEDLKKRKKFETCGGATYLAKIQLEAPVSVNIHQDCKRLKEKKR